MVKPNEASVIPISSAVLNLPRRKSSESVGLHYRLMLLGSANEGKTSAALTAEENLADLIVILLDNGGLDCARGKDVDYIDLTEVRPADICRAMKQALEIVHMEMAEGKKKTCIISSGSTMAMQVEEKARKDFAGSAKLQLWDLVASYQTTIFTQMKALPGNLIFEGHVVPVQVFETKDAAQKKRSEAQLKSQGLEEGDLKLDVSGKVGRYYFNNFPEVWAVIASGGGQNREYAIYPYDNNPRKIKTKSKQRCFDRKEPANLQHMFKKIRGET